MTRFSEPSNGQPASQADFSPDGRYMAFVTSRGILKSNEIESTVWLIQTKLVEGFVMGKESTPAPRTLPRPIATIRAVPKISTYDAYAPVISDLRWSENSRRLYFLGMDSCAERRLYQVEVSSAAVLPLTPAGRAVRQYSLAGPTIAYTASENTGVEQAVPWNKAEAINRDAGAVTGLGLEAILYPDGQGGGSVGVVPDLWVGKEGRFHRVPDASGKKPELDADHYFNALALSPRGRTVIRLLPVVHVENSWSKYIPKPGFESWRIDPKQAYLTSPTYLWRLREYELVDTVTGARRPLIPAPHGSSLAEEDATVAVWSKDGRRVLVGNVALPLTGADPRARREHVCALASVDLPALEARCIVFTRDASAVIPPDNPRPLRLQQARFGATDNDVTANFAWHGRWGQTERYGFDGHKWALTATLPGNPITGTPLAVANRSGGPALDITVKQDLNTPPALWASLDGRSKELWNPNPRFRTIKFGKASLYHWTGKKGYPWEGVLILPADYEPGKRYPLVIQTHGYLPDDFVTDGLFPTAMAARALSSAGFVVLQTGNRPDHYVSLEEAEDAIEEWQSAISALDQEGVIDKSRVGVIGFSRTCWYVERALIEHPGMFGAATVADGLDTSYMTYRLFAEGRPSMAKEYVKIIGAKPSGSGLSVWLRSAPGFHLDRVQAPLRIEAIGPVSVLTEWETYAALRDQHKPVDLIYIPAGQHILQKPWERMASEQGNVDWFRYWLESYEDPDPRKAAQYARWRGMREDLRTQAGHE